MSYNTIGPLPKKSDAPSEKVEKSSGDLDDFKNLVHADLLSILEETPLTVTQDGRNRSTNNW